MIKYQLFEPILNVVVETMPKDNLLNSAALEFFDYIKRVSDDTVSAYPSAHWPQSNDAKASLKPAINHIVEAYRDRLKEITYVETFGLLIQRYEQYQEAAAQSAVTTEDERSQRYAYSPGNSEFCANLPSQTNGKRWAGQAHDLDAAEEEYFNGASDEEEVFEPTPAPKELASSPSKPLVDYADEEEEEEEATAAQATSDRQSRAASTRSRTPPTPRTSPDPLKPITSISEKRRRQEEEDEDELVKLAARKRRSSTSSNSAPQLQLNTTSTNGSTSGSPTGSPTSSTSTPTRKRAAEGRPAGGQQPAKKISISLGPIGRSLGASLGSPGDSSKDGKEGDGGGSKTTPEAGEDKKEEKIEEDDFEKVDKVASPKKEDEDWVEVTPPPKTSTTDVKDVGNTAEEGVEQKDDVEVVHRKEVEA